jgi:hypothetical protein
MGDTGPAALNPIAGITQGPQYNPVLLSLDSGGREQTLN